MAWSQPSAKSLSIFSGDPRVGFTVGFLFVLVGGWSEEGRKEGRNFLLPKQPELGTVQERMYQLGPIFIHISIPKGRHIEGK